MGIINLTGSTKQREAKRLKELEVGGSMSGFIKEFFETTSEKYGNTTMNAVLVSPETKEEFVLFGVGQHLSYLQERLQNNNIALGTYVTITRKTPRKDAKVKYYFEFSADTDRVMDVEQETSAPNI